MAHNRITFLLFPFLAGISADFLLKKVAITLLKGRESISFCSGTIRFLYIENNEGFLGILQAVPLHVRMPILTLGVSILLLSLLFYTLRKTSCSKYTLLSVSCILAGGVGNLLDRFIHNGHVIDYMAIGIGSLQSGIFNLADVLIISGATYLGCTLSK